MVFHWSLSDSKSPQVSRTRLRILAVLSNAVVWIVSTRPPTSKSSRPFNNPFVIVPNAPITIGTIVAFMFHSFFNSLGQVLGCAYTICLHCRTEISCTFPSGSPCRPSHVSPYNPSVLICCIRLLCDWSFRLCQGIAYIYCFDASYLFSLWYEWFVWRCPVLLLGGIPFLS